MNDGESLIKTYHQILETTGLDPEVLWDAMVRLRRKFGDTFKITFGLKNRNVRRFWGASPDLQNEVMTIGQGDFKKFRNALRETFKTIEAQKIHTRRGERKPDWPESQETQPLTPTINSSPVDSDYENPPCPKGKTGETEVGSD